MGFGFFQRNLQGCTFVQQLFEPKLIDLMDCYEKQFIMLWSIRKRLLQIKQLIYFEVTGVSDGFVVLFAHLGNSVSTVLNFLVILACHRIPDSFETIEDFDIAGW